MRNKLQTIKEENTKLNIIIRREIGDNVDLDKAMKDKTYWKGKAEIIEGLNDRDAYKILCDKNASINSFYTEIGSIQDWLADFSNFCDKIENFKNFVLVSINLNIKQMVITQEQINTLFLFQEE